MTERTSYISDGLFYVVMSFVLAGAFGAVIGFVYGDLLGHGWSGASWPRPMSRRSEGSC